MLKIKGLCVLLVICSGTILGILVLFFFNFRHGFSNSLEVWANNGTALGGLITPILTAITALLLYKTIQLNLKQLNEQKTVNALALFSKRTVQLQSKFDKTLTETDLSKSNAVLELVGYLTTAEMNNKFYEIIDKTNIPQSNPEREYLKNALLRVPVYLPTALCIYLVRKGDKVDINIKELMGSSCPAREVFNILCGHYFYKSDEGKKLISFFNRLIVGLQDESALSDKATLIDEFVLNFDNELAIQLVEDSLCKHEYKKLLRVLG